MFRHTLCQNSMAKLPVVLEISDFFENVLSPNCIVVGAKLFKHELE